MFPLAVATAVGAALRLYALGEQPLWLDEATTAWFAERDFYGCLFAETQHPPLYNLLVHFIVGALGTSELALRALPALFGILTVPAVWLLTRRLLPGTESVTALAVAASPFLIFYSQEGRSYALLILLAVLATWAFLRWLDSLAGRDLLIYATLCTLLVYTHYFGAFVLLAHELAYWLHVRRQRRAWFAARVGTLLAFLPWAIWAATRFEAQAREWIGSPLWRAPYALLRYLAGYGVAAADYPRRSESVLEIVQAEALVVLLVIVPWCWLLLRGIRPTCRDPRARTLFVGILLVPVAVVLLISPWMNLVSERYLGFQVPFLLFVVAAGHMAQSTRARSFAAVACAASALVALVAYFAAPGELLSYRLRYGKEDWRGAAAYVESQRPSAVVLYPAYLRLAFKRYWRVPQEEVLILGGEDISVAPERIAYPVGRVALLLSHGGPAEVELQESLEATGHRVGEKLFPQQSGIRVFIYDPRPLMTPPSDKR